MNVQFKVPKVLILLPTLIGIKLFLSCNPLPPEAIQMSYNAVSVNSGLYFYRYSEKNDSRPDTMFAEAVSLKISLLDTSTNIYLSNIYNVIQSFSLPVAHAKSIPISFVSQVKAKDIQIKTLTDIDEKRKAGADISGDFLYDTGDNFALYKKIEEAAEYLNGEQESSEGTVHLVLKTPVQNTMARFQVIVHLDNGKQLSCTSDTFIIKETPIIN